MKIPKQLKILCYDYKVLLRDRSNEDGISNTGTHYEYALKIWIDKEAPRQQQEQTLIHEIVEALNSINNLKFEHQQIEILAVGFYQVLRDNKLI